MSAELLAPKIAEIIIGDSLRSADDEMIDSILQALNSDQGPSIVARTLHDYVGIQIGKAVDGRILALGAEAGVLNVDAMVILAELRKQLEAYVALDAQGRQDFRKQVGATVE